MIGIFDSGFGGLSILKEILKEPAMARYDFVYLGDTARAPYGNRSPEVIYNWTAESVERLFQDGCELVILACFSASAVALRRLQQEYLVSLRGSEATAAISPEKRILGVLIPLAEEAAHISRFGCVGILGTRATVQSGALKVELKKRRPNLQIIAQAAPLLVPLVEEGWINRPETKKIIRYYLRPLKQKRIDTLLLACTHYPLLYKEITAVIGKQTRVVHPGKIVAKKLVDYLARHPEIESRLGKGGARRFLTTDRVDDFECLGSRFLGEKVKAKLIKF
ncbi:MAG: glutamate racemase [Candidatus Magasanikbacteria bacterium]|nr:glutamate racemase [Candidatus Magasanikbacteria bacterium]